MFSVDPRDGYNTIQKIIHRSMVAFLASFLFRELEAQPAIHGILQCSEFE